MRPSVIVAFTIVALGLSGVCGRARSTNKAETIEYVHPHVGARWIGEREPHIFRTRNWKSIACSRTPSLADKAKRMTVKPSGQISEDKLPVNFTAWDKWKHCPSMKQIRDQSNCGSCWAFGAVEAMSDRYCIATNKTDTFSAVDLLSCCDKCGHGCEGGYPGTAWDYWVSEGIATETCRPYPLKPCAHHYEERHYSKCDEELAKTPACRNTCEGWFPPKYNKIRGNSSYNVEPNEKSIMMELYTNGPIEVSFAVYEDFPSYRSGIYFHAWGEFKGYHAVRLVGWGIDRGVPYWLVANSWNAGWGENGFVRFFRGDNECEIESHPVAGLAQV